MARPASASPQEARPPSLSIKACQGYDTVFGSVRNVAVRGQPIMEGSWATEMQYKVCDSLEEVRCTLQIEQSSILGLFSPGTHPVSDKHRFFNSLSLPTHSLAIVIYAKVVTGGHTITDATLSVAGPHNQAEVEQFVRVYGDSYVSKVVMGAEYYACFTYCAKTCEEKMELLAKMKKAGVFSWGSRDSSFDRKIAKFNSVQNTSNMEFCQALRGISGIALPEPTQLLDFVLKMPTLTIDKPQVLHFECLSYEHARDFPVTHFATVLKNKSMIVEDPSFLCLLYKVKVLETDVQTIEAKLRQYGMYKGSARVFLDEVKGALKTNRASVQGMMQKYQANKNWDHRLSHPTKFESLEHEERVQRGCWTEVRSAYLGGFGGSVHDYVTNVGHFMWTSGRIVSIQLCSGHHIDKITINYNNGDKFESGAGWGGTRSNVLHVPDGENFSKIRIKANGQYITYLEFVLTNGNSLAGGDVSSEGAQDITYKPCRDPDYHYFCGFQARSGIYVDGLRAIFAKFQL